jgi:hypothetical protein
MIIQNKIDQIMVEEMHLCMILFFKPTFDILLFNKSE